MQNFYWYSFYLHPCNSDHLQGFLSIQHYPLFIPKTSPDQGASHLPVTDAVEEKLSNSLSSKLLSLFCQKLLTFSCLSPALHSSSSSLVSFSTSSTVPSKRDRPPDLTAPLLLLWFLSLRPPHLRPREGDLLSLPKNNSPKTETLH